MRHVIETARFGRFREKAVSLANSIALHTMQELINPRARSLLFDQNHGAWEGTWAERGVPMVTIPEGELGARNNAGGRIRVPNDGEGYTRPGDPGSRNLSLNGGDGDIYGLLVCNTNDATDRCLVHKQEGNSPTGNGYKVTVKNGQIRGFLKVGGSVIFDFGRDLPLDLLEHVWQLHISPSLNLARFILNGIPLGADETCSTEPAFTNGDYCIGGFADNTGGFIGTLSMVGIAREGDPNICAALNTCRARTPLTQDIRVETHPVEAGHGITDPAPRARMAPPGWMNFALDNSPLNEFGVQGFYTPGHDGALVGWKEGNPIRWRMIDDDDDSEHVMFRGTVANILPGPGTARDNLVEVECETWLPRAMRTSVRQLPIRTNIRSDDAIRYLIDAVDRPPVAVSLAIGDVTFPFVFDDVSPETKVYELLARIVHNEGGLLYEQPDGTLVFESRTQRYFPTMPMAYWDEDSLDDIEADRGVRNLANVIPYTITPRRVGDSATDVLASMPDRVRVLPGAPPQQIELSYRHPITDEAVGGTDVTVPVAVTDYTATEGEDGSGADLTTSAVVAAAVEDIGGTAIKLSVENTGSLAFWFTTQVRGRTLQKLDQRTFFDVRDDQSVNENDELEDPIVFDYLTDQDQARAIAGQELALRRSPYMAPRVAHRIGVDAETEADIMRRMIGELVSVGEPMTALDAADRVFIQGREISYGADLVCRASYPVTRGQAAQSFWIVGEPGLAEVGETTVVA